MKFKDLIKKDLSKVRLKVDIKSFISAIIFNQSFRLIFLFRLSQFKTLFKPIIIVLNRWEQKQNLVFISKHADIGAGFCIGHCFSIIISKCKIGDDVTIMQQVTIGSSRGGG